MISTEELESFYELKEKGIITEEEFNSYRNKFLSQDSVNVKKELDSNVENTCKAICKFLIFLSSILGIAFFIGAIASREQDYLAFSIYFFVYAVYLLLWIFIATIPITIAKNRGVEGGELNTITALSWLGSFFFITWIIAIIFACIYKPTKWINENAHNVKENDAYQSLERLGNLKEKGLITEEEFNREKIKLIGRI